MAKVIELEMFENYTSYGFGEAGKLYKSAEDLGGRGIVFLLPEDRYQTRYTTFTVCFWDSNCVGREVTGGPVSQGAKATLSANAAMIYAGPRMPEPERGTLMVGDYLVLKGLDTILRVVAGSRWESPQLEVVTTREATVDYSDLVAEKNAEPRPYVSEAWLSG